MIIKHRRGTTQEWKDFDIVPAEGELVIEECTDGSRKCKIGTGYTRFSGLPYIDDQARFDLHQEIIEAKAQLESKLSSLGANISTNLVEITALIDSSIAAEVAERTKDVNTLQQNVDSIEQTFDAKLQKSTNQFFEQLAIATSALENKITRNLETLSTNLNNTISETSSEQSANLSSLQEELSASLEQINGQIIALQDDYSLLDQLETTLASDISKIETQLDQLDKDTKSAIDSERSARVNATLGLAAQIDTEVTKINTLIENLIQSTDTKLAAILATSEQALQAQVETFENKLTETVADLTAAYTELQTYTGTNIGIIKNQLGGIDTSLKELFTADQILADTLQALQQENQAVDANILDQIADLHARIAIISSENLGLAKRLDETEETLLASISVLFNDLDKLAKDLDDYINNASTGSGGSNEGTDDPDADPTIRPALIPELDKLKALLIQRIDSGDLALSNRVDTLESSFDTRIATESARIDNQLSENTAEYDMKLSEMASGLTGAIEALEKRIIGEDSEMGGGNGLSLGNIQAQVTNLNNDFAEFEDKLSELEESVTDSLVDGLCYENNELWLTHNGSQVGEAITIVSESPDLQEDISEIQNDLKNLKVDLNKCEQSITALEDTINTSQIVDGLHYEDNVLSLTYKGSPVGSPVTITGGTGVGGGYSTVAITNSLPYETWTISRDTEFWLKFIYTSFRNDVQTQGEGTCTIAINEENIPALFGRVQHGVEKPIEVSKYLKTGLNLIKVTCVDRYGTSESLVYTVNVVELRLETTFKEQRYDSNITFKYKVHGQSEKTVYFLLDNNSIIHEKTFTETQYGNMTETTVTIPKQLHGCHKLVAYVQSVASDGSDIKSDVLTYEFICTEENDKEALLVSNFDTREATQGDLIDIPYIIYDFASNPALVNLNVYSVVNGVEVKQDDYCTTRLADRNPQTWSTRNYPTGKIVFEVSYTYDYYGEQRTITKQHEVTVAELKIDKEPISDSLQLYLTAVGKSNDVTNPAVWEFTRKFLDEAGKETEELITTTFEGFNWKSNGWDPEKVGEPILRLNGDALATIDFKPFEYDFKTNGKTIEFDFAVRDVNNREAVVIDCFEAEIDPITGKETNKGIGFRATPDTAFLKSSDTTVSCRYKDGERVRVSISVEDIETSSRFVSIYLDGILSGVQHYTTSTMFNQSRMPQKIKLGSPYCGLDIYNIRIYDKALSTIDILNNYIADQASPNLKKQLITDNEILDDAGKVSYKKVKALGKIPIITFTGSMPTYKGDKKVVLMDFENPLDPARSFSKVYGGPIQVEIDVQGTSSQYYIRKNWKIKLKKKDKAGNTVFDNAAYQHMADQIPAKVFCIKVDYAEATGTHNTGTANYVENFYDRDEVILPPQKEDSRVRTTIAGFPCIIFEKATEDSEPVFSSKGNFNYDKDAEEAFGFTKNYDSYGVECWEFKNNTSDAVNFAGEIPDNWLDDFEPRYVPKTVDFDTIEDLQKAANKGTISEDDRVKLENDRRVAIANFKQMHDWVVSTATFDLEQVFDGDGKVIGTTKVPLAAEVRRERLTRFKNEFEDYFNMHYSSIYYIYTFFALMTDQRAKNMFLTRWKDDDGVYRWYPYFYDNDTIFGINNEGALVFDYYHEDTDQLGSSNVYNGQNSVLWNNFRECFPDKIQEMYAKLRSDKKLTYDAIIDSYVTQGSDKWSAAIYNADADYKYVSMAREHIDHTDEEGNQVTGLDTSNLYQVRGPGEHHLRYFIANRLNYCDSKWNAGDYPSDFFFLRIYTPQLAEIKDDMSEAKKNELSQSNARIAASLAAVPANPNITVTPFSDMYAGVKYKANGTLLQERLTAGENHTFIPLNPNEIFNDTETAIYGASAVASLGDLSGLYCGVINLVGKNTGGADGKVDANAVQGNVKENKLVELIIGNESADYYNDNFREIEVGTCRLLQKIDLRHCSGLGKSRGIAGEKVQTTLDLTGCPNIEEIYLEGTNLLSVDLPDGGYVKTLHLPASTGTLVIKNQKYISDFQIESYINIRTLQIENSNLNTTTLLENCCGADGKYTVLHVSLTDVQLGTKEDPVTADFIKSLFAVYDNNGALISGIRGLGDAKQAYIKGTCYIEELSGEDYAEIKEHYPDLTINFSKMRSVVAFNYTDANGNEHVETKEIYSENSKAGSISEFVPEFEPYFVLNNENEAFTYKFIGFDDDGNYTLCGWSQIKRQESKGVDDHEDDYKAFPDAINGSSFTNIIGNRTLYPVFKATRKSYPITFKNPTAPESEQTLAVVSTPYGSDADYTGATPSKLDVASPDSYEFIGWNPSPTHITGELTCYAQFALKDQNRLPDGEDDGDTLPGYTIGWMDLRSTNPETGEDVYGYSLYPSDNTMVITECFNKFNTAIRIPEAFISDFDGVEYNITKLGGFRGHSQLDWLSLPNTLQELSNLAFYNCSGITSVEIPNSVTIIGSQAFRSCSKLTSVSLGDSVKTIGSYAFAECPLSELELPAKLETIEAFAFSKCKLESLYIPANVTNISEGAFAECTSLQQVSVAEDHPNFMVDTNNRCLIEKLDESNTKLLQGFTAEAKIPDNVNYLGQYCFAGLPIQSIEIPNKITIIPANAFYHCAELSNITFNENITSLEATSFTGCKLSSITLPSKLESIKTYVFNTCPLQSIVIPAAVTSVGDHAFGENNDLTTVIFEKSEDGHIPFIHHRSFANSGAEANPVKFYFPWSPEEHYEKFEKLTAEEQENGIIKDPTFGAATVYFHKNDDGTYDTNMIFNYEEAN